MSSTGEAAGAWQLDLVEDVEMPGWVWLPEDLDAAQRRGWVEEVLPAVQELISPDGPADPAVVSDIRAVLEMGLDARAESPSYLMYLVFPMHAPVAVMCNVNAVQTQDLPAWDEFAGRMHAVESRHIGPGVQITTDITAETDHGPAELTTVLYIFTDEEAGIVVNLEPAFPELIAQTMLGAGVLMNALSVTRPDGSTFQSAPSTAPMIGADEWPSGSEGAS